MISHLIAACVGGAIIYLFPGLGTAGNAWFKRVKAWWAGVGK